MTGLNASSLPTFAEPPVQEVAIGVQFRPVFGLRGIRLGPLREQWQSRYPIVEERPPLAPVIEAANDPTLPMVFGFGAVPQSRYWFLDEAGTHLVQVQDDRLIVNWRRGDPPVAYPRYPNVRARFVEALEDFGVFLDAEGLGGADIVQVELTYINQLDWPGGTAELPLRGLSWPVHHLGAPSQMRLNMRYDVPDLGVPPVRMYVSFEPALGAHGQAVTFFTLTVRGAPAGPAYDETLRFLDAAHEHIVVSFTELTSPSMHEQWRRTR